jgi:hypothetical protein
MMDGDLEQRLERMYVGYANLPVDTEVSWRRFVRLRRRAAIQRRAIAVGAAVAVVAAAAVAATFAYHRNSAEPSVGRHVNRPAHIGRLAITARISQPGGGSAPGDLGIAGTIVGQRGAIWGITYVSNLSQIDHSSNLFRIDQRTNHVTFSEHIAGLRQITAGGGAIWVLTTAGGPDGQVLKLDPVTGRIMRRFALTRRCDDMSYGTQFWLSCGSRATEFVRLDPATGRVLAMAGPANGVIDIAATPDGIWYVGNAGISGYVGTGARLRWINVNGSAYPVSFGTTDSFLYADGSLWDNTDDESVAKIDSATGKITRIYGYQSYDPKGSLGLNFMTVGLGSLWFLEDNGPAAVSVLRASIATGQTQGSVTDYHGTCGEPCWQIYSAGGSIWVPTQTHITRIDPVRREGRG